MNTKAMTSYHSPKGKPIFQEEWLVFSLAYNFSQNWNDEKKKPSSLKSRLAAFVARRENKWAKGRLPAMLRREVVHY